jgi:hypothetical protein
MFQNDLPVVEGILDSYYLSTLSEEDEQSHMSLVLGGRENL